MDKLPESLGDYPTDSYFLVRDGTNSLDLYYLDPAGKTGRISMEEVGDLNTILNASGDEEKKDRKIREEINLYRIKNSLPLITSKTNIHNQVGVGSCHAGQFLFSKNFQPCQAVVARLNNGQFVLYHAFVQHDDVDGFKQFIELVRGRAKEVVVFQKLSNPSNMEKAPYLAINLARHLNMKVKRLTLATYENIIVDAQNSRIVLSKKISTFTGSQKKEVRSRLLPPVAVDSAHPVSLYQSSREIFRKNRYEARREGDQFLFAARSFSIPVSMVSSKTRAKWQQRLNQRLLRLVSRKVGSEKDKKKVVRQAELLIRQGADTRFTDREYRTPLQIAMEQKNRQLVN